MKRLFFYHMALVALLIAIIPLTLTASEISLDKHLRRDLSQSLLPMFQDSTSRTKPESKRQDQPEKTAQEIQGERLKEAQKRGIKQVPRSIPKLKPQPVLDGIKIRRPPLKVPKKGLTVNRF